MYIIRLDRHNNPLCELHTIIKKIDYNFLNWVNFFDFFHFFEKNEKYFKMFTFDQGYSLFHGKPLPKFRI